eukprot:75968_1
MQSEQDEKHSIIDAEKEKELYEFVDIDFVYNAITGPLTLIDLRSLDEYTECHIYKAIQVTIKDSYLSNSNDIANISQLNSSHPSRLEEISGKLIILYSSNDINPMFYDFIFKLFLNKQNTSTKIKYFAMKDSFHEFKLKYPYLCQYNGKMVENTEKPMFNQKYINQNEEKQESILEESNILTNKRYQKVLSQCDGYPNVIVKDKLYLGDARQAVNWSVVYHLQITHILNVTKAAPNQFSDSQNLENIKNDLLPSVYEHYANHPIKYLQLQVLDEVNESFDPYFDKTFKFMDDAMHENNACNNNKILVHCQMGISRSATMLIGYLMHHKQMSLVDSYAHVKKCRNVICPNNGFLKQLMVLEQKLFDAESTVYQLQERDIRDLTSFRQSMNDNTCCFVL